MSSSTGQRSCQSQQENYSDHVHVLNRLLKTLRDSDIPGPQLFRLDKEFKQPLGHGTEGNVRGIDRECAKDYYHKAGQKVLRRWPLETVAIKRHQRPPSDGSSASNTLRDNLANRFHAAEREVLTLTPDHFRGNPNIVQLKGWGLCLDTIEDHQSKCCESIQMPLLILERAYKNLYEFLQEDLFPPKRTSATQSSSVEEYGRSQGQPTTGIQRYVEAAARWAGIGPDVYEVIRSLCVDIGRGLDSLHQANFNHGDLKPQNVLIFRDGTKWVAKLCDFGCAQGSDEPGQDSYSRGHPYRGTKAWHPPAKEISGLLSREDLRRCDIYVYGLIVWSAFYLKGEPPPRPNLADATSATRALFGKELDRGSGKRYHLAVSIDKVFEDSFCPARERPLKPWVRLEHQDKHRQEADDEENQVTNGQRETGFPLRRANAFIVSTNLQPPLTREEKAVYATREWWRTRHKGNPPSSQQVLNEAVIPYIGNFVPAVSSDSDIDDIHYSMDLFVAKHRADIRPLIAEMTGIMMSTEHQDRYPNRDPAVDLYCCAKFRSRVPLEWWQEHNDAKLNFLDQALRYSPAIDICTLAWLCKGPVGNAEIQDLPADSRTWRVIYHPGYLNESERLDRLLLFLEFGARLETEIVLPGGPAFGGKSVLIWFLRNCRKATIPFVIREIGRRWDAVKHSSHISPATKAHLTGRDEAIASSDGAFKLVRRATGTFKSTPDSKAAKVASELSSFFGPDIGELWERYLDDSNVDIGGPGAESASAPDETTSLLHPHPKPPTSDEANTLPLGWKLHHKNRLSLSPNTCYFEDESTGSITLTEPKISFLKLRQVKVGFLNETQGPAANLDLTQYTASRLAMAEQDRQEETQSRFPFYDDEWFAFEREKEHPREDVLAGMKDIRSFAERIVIPSALSTLAQNIWLFVMGIVWFVVALLALVIMLALALAGLGLLLLAAWAILPSVMIAVGWWYLVWMVLLIVGLATMEPATFEGWYVASIYVANPLALVAFLWMMQDPCPEGPVGTLPGGEMCHRCWWLIWSFFRCKLG